MKDIAIHYGIMHDSIPDQLAMQGLIAKDASKFDQLRMATNHLLLADLIPDSVATKCFKKIQARLAAQVEEEGTS